MWGALQCGLGTGHVAPSILVRQTRVARGVEKWPKWLLIQDPCWGAVLGWRLGTTSAIHPPEKAGNFLHAWWPLAGDRNTASVCMWTLHLASGICIWHPHQTPHLTNSRISLVKLMFVILWFHPNVWLLHPPFLLFERGLLTVITSLWDTGVPPCLTPGRRACLPPDYAVVPCSVISHFLTHDDVITVGATTTGWRTTHRSRGFSPLHTQPIQVLSLWCGELPLVGACWCPKPLHFCFPKKKEILPHSWKVLSHSKEFQVWAEHTGR